MPVLRQIQGETAVESFTGFARISTKNMSETGFFHLRDGNPHIYCAGYEIINARILFVRIMCHIVTGIVFLSHRAQVGSFLTQPAFTISQQLQIHRRPVRALLRIRRLRE